MLDHLCLRLQDREHHCGNLLSEARKVLRPELSAIVTLLQFASELGYVRIAGDAFSSAIEAKRPVRKWRHRVQ
jgi:hypothetical protein